MRRIDLRLVQFTHQEEGEADTPKEEPLANREWNGNTAIVRVLGTAVEDSVGPGRGGQHGNRGEDIGNVDQETLQHDDVQPEVPGIHG